MKTTKFIIFWGLGLVAWAAPTVSSGLIKRSDPGSAAVVMVPRVEEVDDDVIYTDYKRASQPEESDEDVIYTDYKRVAQPEEDNDEDVIYTDY